MSKHQQILSYIEQLPVGSKISVRSIARDMNVSEGTAYRAIKEAEVSGFVSSIERVGTVRIEKQQKKNIERLTFAEVVNIVDGTVLGGRGGLHKTLHKFVIGAMEINEMIRYIDRDSLLIVGNRVKVHSLSLEHGAAVLISGGFDTTDEVRALADRLELPLISSAYDTFTIASLINRAIYDRLIKKDILLIEDIVPANQTPLSLKIGDRVEDWHRSVERSGLTRFPVVDPENRVVGMVTAKDVSGQTDDVPIERVMTKNVITVSLKSSVASAAHTMVWEGIELLPVVRGRYLIGVISRQDVIKAMQTNQKQPQMGDTIHDLILSGFAEHVEDKTLVLTGEVSPQMASSLGGVSSGVVMTLVSEAAALAIRRVRNANMVPENVTLYFLRPIQIDSILTVKATVLDIGRRFGKADVELYVDHELVGKALFTGGVLQR